MNYKVVILTLSCLLFGSCFVDDTPDREFKQLPELTNEGAGMLAFNHETESYVDTNGLSNVAYQLQSDGPVLVLATSWDDREISDIVIRTRGVELTEGLTLEFSDRIPGFAFYSFLYRRGGASAFVISDVTSTGALTITHFDETNNIVSGTFSTEYIHPFNGKLVKITNGRFDTFFRR